MSPLMSRMPTVGFSSFGREKSGLDSVGDEFFGAKMIRTDSNDLIVRGTPRYTVSVWTCSKIALASFTLGVIVGFSLNRRFRRWAKRWLDKS